MDPVVQPTIPPAAETAASAPATQTPTPPKEKFNMKTLLFIALALIVGAVIGTSMNGCSKSAPAAPAVAQTPEVQAQTHMLPPTMPVVNNHIPGSRNTVQSATESSGEGGHDISNDVAGNDNTVQTVVIRPPAVQNVTVNYPSPAPVQVLPPPPPPPAPIPAPQAVPVVPQTAPQSSVVAPPTNNDNFTSVKRTIMVEGMGLVEALVLQRTSNGMFVGPAGNPPASVTAKFVVAKVQTGNAGFADLYIQLLSAPTTGHQVP